MGMEYDVFISVGKRLRGPGEGLALCSPHLAPNSTTSGHLWPQAMDAVRVSPGHSSYLFLIFLMG